LTFYQSFRRVVDECVPFATDERILHDFVGSHSVYERVLAHSHEEIRVAEPSNTFVHVGDSSQRDLSVERIDEAGDESEYLE
jgi:hypothetical protein